MSGQTDTEPTALPGSLKCAVMMGRAIFGTKKKTVNTRVRECSASNYCGHYLQRAIVCHEPPRERERERQRERQRQRLEADCGPAACRRRASSFTISRHFIFCRRRCSESNCARSFRTSTSKSCARRTVKVSCRVFLLLLTYFLRLHDGNNFDNIVTTCVLLQLRNISGNR